MSESNRYSRRTMLNAGLTLGVGVAAGAIGGPDLFAATEPIATTTYGKVRGVTNAGVHAFKGIPYGASTAGKNRFMPPKPPLPWTQVRDALDYGPSAPQTDPSQKRADLPENSLGALFVNDRPESEDCLVLNVWTRGLTDNAKRPVMFWMHGGGFTTGSGSSFRYDGTNLCKRGDVVVVTINHRLNVMGFAFLGDLGGEAFAQSANVGMLDIVQALTWVRDNIEQFGGDPHRVMIFGESGGGRKVGTLLAMPAAKGLFQRAVMQSGPAITAGTRQAATSAAQAVLDELQIAKQDIRRLQEVPLARLMTASRKHGFGPVVDGTVLPRHPFHPSASLLMPDVPLIIGANRTEATMFARNDAAAFTLDEAGLQTRVKAMLGDKAAEILAIYKQSVPKASPSELYFLISTDQRYCVPSMTIAERRAALKKAPVYFYYFAWQTPVEGGRLMSPHALEITFVFDNTEASKRFTGGGPHAAALAAKMSEAWIAFAKSGSPNTPTLPTWTPYDSTHHATMVFNDTSQVEHDPIRERRIAMQRMLNLAS